MKFPYIYRNSRGEIRTLWRMLIFIAVVLITVAPLLFVKNSLIQFGGAVVILIGILYLNARFFDKLTFEEYGLVFNWKTFEYLFVGLILGSVSVVLIFLIGTSTNILAYAKGNNVDVSVSVLFAFKMLMVGIWEEVFFRGYLFTTIYEDLKTKISRKHAVIIALVASSLIFGFAHIGTPHASIISTLFLFINGIVWCIPLIITRNLGLSIGLHSAWNFTQTQFGFTMSGNKAFNSFYEIENVGPEYLTGGEYGLEAGFLGLFGYLIMLLFTMGYVSFMHNLRNFLR